MAEAEIKIEGMSCEHCVLAVRREISNLPGVIDTRVKVGTAVVKYEESKVGMEEIEKGIAKAGFTVKK